LIAVAGSFEGAIEAAEEAAGLINVDLEPLGVNVDPVKATDLDAPAIRSRDFEAGEV
jgi:hypothetical protein